MASVSISRVASGVPPDVEGERLAARASTHQLEGYPPGRMPGSTAGETPATTSLIVRSCGVLLIAFQSFVQAAVSNGQLLEQGQRAFDNGKFSQAAEQWQKALNGFRRKPDEEAVIQTSIYLADAYEALGQY